MCPTDFHMSAYYDRGAIADIGHLGSPSNLGLARNDGGDGQVIELEVLTPIPRCVNSEL